MNDKNKEQENAMAMVTMCLTENRAMMKKMTNIILAVILGWTLTTAGFIWYLSQYEVEISTFGNFDNSKVNTSQGQFNEKVDTFTINNHGVDMNEGKK